MNLALKEALHTIPKEQFNMSSAALQEFKMTFGVETDGCNEKWLVMPRQFARSAARFSIPINTQKLETITPFEYLSQYVWISDHRKHLYRFVFNKYVSESDHQETESENDDDYERETPSNETNEKSIQPFEFKENFIRYDVLIDAFTDVLGYCGSVEQLAGKIENIIRLAHLNEIEHHSINFRSWCGLVAFAERYLNKIPFNEDPCDEVHFRMIFVLQKCFFYSIKFLSFSRWKSLISKRWSGN